jgi:integrase
MTKADRFAFTMQRLGSIPAPVRGETVFYDTVVPALGMRVRPGGARSFFIRARFRKASNPQRVTIGDIDIGVKAARDAAIKALRDRAMGGDPITEAKAERLAERQRIRLVEALKRYDDHITRRGLVNARIIINLLQRYLAPLLKVPLAAITRRDIAACIEKVERDGLIGAAQDVRTKTTTFLNWAGNEGLIVFNPLAGWRRPRLSRAEQLGRQTIGRILSRLELQAYIHACDALRRDGDAILADYAMMVLLTGQRRSETAALRHADIVRVNDRWEWRIPAGRSKNARAHRVPLPEPALAIVRAQLPWATLGGGYRFASRHDRPINGWSKRLAKLNHEIRRQLGHTAERMRVALTARSLRTRPITDREAADAKTAAENWRPIGWHDIRKTFRSGLTELGIDSAVAERMLNHTRDSLLEIYDRAEQWDKRCAAADAWAGLVAELSRPDRPYAPAPSKRLAAAAAEVEAFQLAGHSLAARRPPADKNDRPAAHPHTKTVTESDQLAIDHWNTDAGGGLTLSRLLKARRRLNQHEKRRRSQDGP